MGAFLVYSIEVAVVMSVLYLGYKWLLSSATFHTFNRVMLLIIYGVSLTLPLAVPLLRFSTQKTAAEIGFPLAVPADIAAESDEAYNQTAQELPSFHIDWAEVLGLIYIAGAIIFLILLLVSVAKVVRIISKGTPLEDYDAVYVSDMATSPFSWGGRIILTPDDTGADMPHIIAHEQTHLEKRHWLDLAFAQIVSIFQWFSPASYLMMRELKIVHEFEVDEIVSHDNPYAYQMMLIKKTAGSSFPTFADSLNSQLKIRITMMLSKRSNGKRRYAAAALLPMAAIAAFALSQPAVAGILANIDPAVTDSEFTNFSPSAQAGEELSKTQTEETADNKSEKLIIKAVAAATPEGTIVGQIQKVEQTQKVEKKSDNVIVIRNSDIGNGKGKPIILLDGKPFEGDIKEIDPENIERIDVKKGEEYPAGQIIIYTKEYAKAHPEVARKNQEFENNTNTLPNGEEVYVAVEEMTNYPGGQEALLEYLNNNIKLPDTDFDSVRVIVKFVVNKDGSISNPKILKPGPDKAFNDEAIRLVMGMPKWIPAKNNGKPVNSYFNIPITFKK